jgi:hypothetical protein
MSALLHHPPDLPDSLRGHPISAWGAEIRSCCSPVLVQETAEPVVPTDFTSLCIADSVRAIG